MSIKALKNKNGVELDPMTVGLTSGQFINQHPPITQIMKGTGKSRLQVLIEENLCPPPLQSEGMWLNGEWQSFKGLPPLFNNGPKKGRKQRRRDAV